MLFDGLLFSAETDQCLTPSFLSGQAVPQIFFGGQLEVRRKFGVQVVVQFVAAKNRDDPMKKLLKPVDHCSSPSCIPRTRLMTLASLCQFTASSESCLRPFLVME